MIDDEGFRQNVGIIIINKYQDVFWGGRIGQPDAWQFPQGGINEDESPEEAVYRELEEETGLTQDDVRLIAQTQDWLRYRLPQKYLRHDKAPLCIGQKQKWFLLELIGPESNVRFDHVENPEFDRWKWVDYWHPLDNVILFKRRVYASALNEFKPIVFGTHAKE
jgi:putative (di)nucleoside polyphosphate hydrolase